MTNHIEVKTADEFISEFTPTYIALLPTFLRRSKQYTIDEGMITLKKIEAQGDLESKHFGSKDSLIHQILTTTTKKAFNKYFKAAQYIHSQLQDSSKLTSVNAQVLDAHNKQADKMFLSGEGSAPGNVLNNGLFFSADPNYVLKTSVQVAKDANNNHLSDMYAKITNVLEEVNQVAGQKLVLVYGDVSKEKLTSLFVETKTSLIKTLRDAFPGVGFEKMPAGIAPAGEGFIVVNLDGVMLHYTTLPIMRNQGINEQDMYAWANFLLGSTMLEVEIPGAVSKQPLTYQA